MKKMYFFAALGLVVLSAFALTTCDFDKFVSNISPAGIYVGVIAVDGNNGYWSSPVKDLVDEARKQDLITINTLSGGYLAYLDDETVGNLKTGVLGLYQKSNSLNNPVIVYGVDQVIEKRLLKYQKSFQKDLANVTIVTFTAGADQGSGTLSNQSDDAFGTKVQTKIRGTGSNAAGQKKIRGQPINAYAIALPTSNQAIQNKNLNYITSGTDAEPNIVKITNINSLNSAFADIANSLTTISRAGSVNITISGPSAPLNYTAGDNFIATFDGKNTEQSSRYIKGKVFHTGSRWEIQNLSAVGIDLKGTTVAKQSGIRGINVDFNFPNITGIKNTDKMNQYRYENGVGWTPMTGGSAENATYGNWFNFLPSATKKTAVIYLVLDATLSDTDIATVKAAAANFIQTLYEESLK